jgi:UDP-glucose 4-epimerase
MASVSPAAAVYGVTKLLGEQLGLLYAQRHGIGFSGMRFSSVYGERQHARAVNANFIAETHDRIRRGERPVIVGDGREVHDYVHVTDVAAGCIAAMLRGRGGQVLNLCTGVDTTHTALVETLLQVCGATGLLPDYRADTRTVKSAGGTHLGFSPAKARREIGWEAQLDLRAGLARYIAWRNAQGPAA